MLDSSKDHRRRVRAGDLDQAVACRPMGDGPLAGTRRIEVTQPKAPVQREVLYAGKSPGVRKIENEECVRSAERLGTHGRVYRPLCRKWPSALRPEGSAGAEEAGRTAAMLLDRRAMVHTA